MSKLYKQSEFSKARVKEIQDQIRAGKRPFAPLDTGSARAELERLATPFPITAGEMREGLAQITGPSRLDVITAGLEAEGMSPALITTHTEIAIQAVERDIIEANPGLNLEGRPDVVRAEALRYLMRPAG